VWRAHWHFPPRFGGLGVLRVHGDEGPKSPSTVRARVSHGEHHSATEFGCGPCVPSTRFRGGYIMGRLHLVGSVIHVNDSNRAAWADSLMPCGHAGGTVFARW